MTNNKHNLDELLTHSLLGETSPAEEKIVTEALANDEKLRAEYEARKESIAMLQRLSGASGDVRLSEERRAEVLTAATPAASTQWRAVLSWAAAICIIGVGVVLLGVLESETESDRREQAEKLSTGMPAFEAKLPVKRVLKKQDYQQPAADTNVLQDVAPLNTRVPTAESKDAPSAGGKVAGAPKNTPAGSPTRSQNTVNQIQLYSPAPMDTQADPVLTLRAAGDSPLANQEYPEAYKRGEAREALTRGPSGTHARLKPDKILAERRAPAPRSPAPPGRVVSEANFEAPAGLSGGLERRERSRRAGYLYEGFDVDRYLQWVQPRPQEKPSAMFFRYWGDNPFVDAAQDPQSTFGLDVDTASYTVARKYIRMGKLPPKAAIRTEEFVNYFSSNYPAPTATDLALHVDRAPSRFAHRDNVELIKIGVKAREAGERGPLALTLLIDVSGSMRNGNRLGLVKDAVRTLLTALRPDDSVAIVTFQSQAQTVLTPTPIAQVDKILTALSSLAAGGSTNLEGGLHLAYPLAEQQFQAKGHNRVLIFSDGVANVGLTDPEGILNGIAEKRRNGIYLDSFGVGMGNHNDHLLEQLADRGDGSCSYVDTLAEATRIFRKNLNSVFVTVAKDAKVQVEFDPKVVVSYRQIGYENRAIADKNFRNDAIDAGEVGAGHEVVALYEVELRPDAVGSPAVVRLRYKSIESADTKPEVVELEKPVPAEGAKDFDSAPDHFRLSASVAAFAEHLRGSYWARSGHLAEVLEEAQPLTKLDTSDDQRVTEWVSLMQRGKALIESRPELSDSQRLIDELKKNNYLRKRYEELAAGEAKDVLDELRKQNEELEKKIRELHKKG